MRNLRILVAGTLALVAIVAAGCGGDDEPSIQDIVNELESTTTTATEPTTLSKSEVIASGDAICAETNAAIASLAVDADRAVAADQVRAITEGLRDELRELDLPSGDRAAFNDLVGALGDQIAALERRASTARAGDEAGYEAAGVELASAREAARVAAEEYGFESCGQPFDQIPTEPDGGSGGVSPDTPVTPTPTTPTPTPSPGGGTGAPDDGGSGGGGGSSGSSGGISPG